MADMKNLGQKEVQENKTEKKEAAPAKKLSFAQQQEAREAMEASKKNEKSR
jgi:hypothetical protein